MASPTLYVVAPGPSDSDQAPKRAIVEAACAQLGCAAYYPPYNGASATFDLASEIEAIRNAKLALVDLSEERPSCYFELGLIEALGAAVLVVARKGTAIHQTSHRSDVRYFEDLSDFRNLVEEALSSLRT